jgi:hypothetical protein
LWIRHPAEGGVFLFCCRIVGAGYGVLVGFRVQFLTFLLGIALTVFVLVRVLVGGETEGLGGE